MPIVFIDNTLKSGDTQIRLYSNISNRILVAGTTPYIKHTETPRFMWLAQGVEEAGPLTYRVQITWIGNSAIVPIKEIDVSGITTNSFAVGLFQRLKYVLAADAGGSYEIIVTASQSGQSDVRIGGQFRINFKPTPPINLQVT